MQTATQRVSVRTGAVTTPGGFTLAARAVNALLVGDYRFEREFGMEGGGEVWGVYKGQDAQPSYAVDAVRTQAGEPVISRCNCEDASCRKRTCKHQILLSVVSGYALRVGSSVLRFASALLASPSALAQAVTERAAAVERVEQGLPAAPPQARAPRQPRSVQIGDPCPRCGHGTAVEHEAGLRQSYLACQNRMGFCTWHLAVDYDYGLMAWVEVAQ